MFNRFDKVLGEGPSTTIVETGFSGSVLHLADYAERFGSFVHSVDLNVDYLHQLHTRLEEANLAPFVSLHLQEPTRFLNSLSWMDAAFLFARMGLPGTMEHTKIAMSAGARLIVLSNYSTEAAWAVQFAKKQKWNVEHNDDGLSILTRP